eukprot:4456557-Lingulodinium_polyedra.AAC.1
MEHAEYLRKYGDPAANGRGDKTVPGPQGQKLVQMKGDAMWVKRRSGSTRFRSSSVSLTLPMTWQTR